jgi:LacI family transcriptional regulator
VPDYEACDKVRINDEEAATIAAQKIISSGYKKVLAIFGNPELSITRKREKTFIQILEYKIQSKNLIVEHATSAGEAQQETTLALKSKNKPEVIFCMSDEVLAGVMKSIQKLKLSMPDDVAVISISNDSFIPTLFEPEITYVETSGYELGKLAFKRMTDFISGKTFIQEVLLPPKLIEGNRSEFSLLQLNYSHLIILQNFTYNIKVCFNFNLQRSICTLPIKQNHYNN